MYNKRGMFVHSSTKLVQQPWAIYILLLTTCLTYTAFTATQNYMLAEAMDGMSKIWIDSINDHEIAYKELLDELLQQLRNNRVELAKSQGRLEVLKDAISHYYEVSRTLELNFKSHRINSYPKRFITNLTKLCEHDHKDINRKLQEDWSYPSNFPETVPSKPK